MFAGHQMLDPNPFLHSLTKLKNVVAQVNSQVAAAPAPDLCHP